MTDRYDVIVAGLGAMGSASAYHLARRGLRVLGLDRWPQPHAHGSSHGDSRIIREMYFEHPLYVPLVQRAYELWRELERDAGEPLMRIHGGLMIGPRDGMLITGTLRSAAEHGLPYELLSPAAVRVRFPAFAISGDLVAVFDPRAGYLHPEACTAAHLALAARHGADLRYGEPVAGWEEDGDGVRVRTATQAWTADRLLVTAGAWTRELLGGIDLPLTVERQVPFWFDLPAGEDYEPERCPIYAWEHTTGFIGYGFPRLEKGVKAARMHQGETAAHPDGIRRTVDSDEVEPLRAALRQILPAAAAAPVRESTTCLFTNTPDGDFAIGFHPAHPRVLISTPCSGHGFKFASAIGELHADLLTEGRTRFDLAPFRLERFG
ncbi:N-methyl-L-tryptophan oxidase [Longimicrobium sp.]|uniref:N-methyl-L-tryptophan oxidase n=1 Tax=Longimicrobium sp. TaxID=2029185 RepID=UPI002C972687|nr:N-methyl-L-tryptophan oxidase [Longimicrobium sp.]HSU15849.1 N-methyl-L-tryptophan oxidase [Longimicrobium sp.]